MNKKDVYLSEGYVVYRNLIDHDLIDACLKALEIYKKSNWQIYFSQSRHKWIKSNVLTNNGFLMESIQHPSRLVFAKKIRSSVLNIITNHAVASALSEITGYQDFIRWQDMLFDKSTGTMDHADNWYLDTFPPGNMVATWIAMEDINKDAGRFYVVPKSHLMKLPLYQEVPSHQDYLNLINQKIDEDGLERLAPDMKKGDVIFWNSKTIHGSFSQKNEMYSRKSITAHFHPVGFARDKSRGVVYTKKYMKNMITTNNPHIFLDNTDPNTFQFITHGYLRYLKRKIFGQEQEELSMSRTDGY
jgi:phytanoyl-CoA hydroxylase